MAKLVNPPAGAMYLLIPEAATVARVSVHTVRTWIRTGKLRSSRPGRRRLILRSDLEHFLASHPLVVHPGTVWGRKGAKKKPHPPPPAK